LTQTHCEGKEIIQRKNKCESEAEERAQETNHDLIVLPTGIARGALTKAEEKNQRECPYYYFV